MSFNDKNDQYIDGISVSKHTLKGLWSACYELGTLLNYFTVMGLGGEDFEKQWVTEAKLPHGIGVFRKETQNSLLLPAWPFALLLSVQLCPSSLF